MVQHLDRKSSQATRSVHRRIAGIDLELINLKATDARANPRLREIHCLHVDDSEPLHRMLNAIQPGSHGRDAGSSGRTPYLSCLARPQGHPPNVSSVSMVCSHFAQRTPRRARVQTGQRFSQNSGSKSVFFGLASAMATPLEPITRQITCRQIGSISAVSTTGPQCPANVGDTRAWAASLSDAIALRAKATC
jgi:hypothetical protein